jgi:glutamate-ammonia-ligase adenylyltransferase
MTAHGPRDLLLARHLTPDEVVGILQPYGFRDPLRADRELQAMSGDPRARALLAALLPELLSLLARAPDPDQGLSLLERFLRASLGPRELLEHLGARPGALEVLVTVLGSSPFLAETLIRSPNWFYWVAEPEVLAHPRRPAEIAADLRASLAPLRSEGRRLDALRVVRRREILHIGVRDLLRHADVEETLVALSSLADVLVGGALELAGGGAGFVVLALGKLGGEELNFSSDVDLLYLYDSDRGRPPAGSRHASRSAHFEHLARRLTAALAETTAEGQVCRVDLRLRPEGTVGAVASSLRAAVSYYRARGATWERLALLKARPVAGDLALGRRFLSRVRPFVFGRPFGPRALAEVAELKRRIDGKVAARRQSHRNVKLGIGGIREIELVVQTLQLRFARRRPGLRQRSTLDALGALRDHHLLDPGDHDRLAEAYRFLRDVENKLQMVADTQTHSLPERGDALEGCALRLGYRPSQAGDAGEAFLADHQRHTAAVHRIFLKHLGPADPLAPV